MGGAVGEAVAISVAGAGKAEQEDGDGDQAKDEAKRKEEQSGINEHKVVDKLNASVCNFIMQSRPRFRETSQCGQKNSTR